ncbi:MAG: hypothetical protein M3317_14395 [Actinomycetota bacterium]|nr:hypothetical protein [Actinomycetota bacterium]
MRNARGYIHRPNATNAASNVATNANGILASLGRLFEGVEVFDDVPPEL